MEDTSSVRTDVLYGCLSAVNNGRPGGSEGNIDFFFLFISSCLSFFSLFLSLHLLLCSFLFCSVSMFVTIGATGQRCFLLLQACRG